MTDEPTHMQTARCWRETQIRKLNSYLLNTRCLQLSQKNIGANIAIDNQTRVIPLITSSPSTPEREHLQSEMYAESSRGKLVWQRKGSAINDLD